MVETEKRGRKKIDDRLVLKNYRASSLISAQALSLLLTNKEQNIRLDKPVPEKYKKDLKKLFEFMENWVVNIENK